jgi:hypothetical protein
MKNLRIPAVLLLASAAAFCGTAAAQTKTWNFADRTPSGSCTAASGSAFGLNGQAQNANLGNVINCTQQPSGTTVDLTLRAYSTGTGTTLAAASVNDQGGNGVAIYNTNEVRNGAEPDHGMDNSNGTDMMLLSFTSAEILRRVTVGWTGTDGDFSVLRWNGASNASQSTVQSSIVGKTVGELQSSGWSLVNTFDGLGGVNNPDAVFNVSGTTASSYWLISAYNSAFGGSVTGGIDSLKLMGVATGISAPGTLALAGLGLLGMGVLRRRRA